MLNAISSIATVSKTRLNFIRSGFKPLVAHGLSFYRAVDIAFELLIKSNSIFSLNKMSEMKPIFFSIKAFQRMQYVVRTNFSKK